MPPTLARRRLPQVLVALAVALVATSCQATWGLRQSYRDYVTSPVGGGSIVAADGAGWTSGSTSGQGPFTWPVAWAAFDESTETGTVQFKGTVATKAHQTANGHVLDTTFSNPRLEIAGDVGTLVVDLNYRPYTGPAPVTLPPLAAALDVDFATLDLSGQTWTPDANGNRTISAAPATGIPAAMALIGWDQFYGSTVTLDPFSATFAVSAPAADATPSITVSRTTGLVAGDTITVWGRGLDPAAHNGTRPPLNGQPSGDYVVFGRFATAWQPSTGAASTTRTVIQQKWALPEVQHLAMDPTQTNPSFVRVDAQGNFEATLVVGTSTAAGNYGVYVYPGSGAVHAGHELATLVEVVE